VCNNGGSVSLLKQSRAANERWFDDGAEPFLRNSPVEPTALAAAMGLSVDSVDFTGVDLAAGDDDAVEAAGVRLEESLVKALAARTPHLVELRLPADAEAWAGIWITGGFDERAAGSARS
jgi:acetolactate synthase-1/2/3 large subunit